MFRHASEHLHFTQEVTSRLASSQDIKQALLHTFNYISRFLPIDAISLHQFSEELHSLNLLFLVQKNNFQTLCKSVPLDSAEIVPDISFPQNDILWSTGNCLKNFITNRHAQALTDSIPYKERAYLMAKLIYGGENVGHVCFMGKQSHCFTSEHEEMFKLIRPVFALIMAQLQQLPEVLAFKQSLFPHGKSPSYRHHPPNLHIIGLLGTYNGLSGTVEAISQLRGREVPVLIGGETGTGKELVAEAVQKVSPRSELPFIKINCGAIPESLLDSELFGYEKGAFTGATSSKPGRFELAHKGTLFLDEVGELPLSAQVRLLRVLQNGVVERVGGTKSIKVDVRIIAATNRNLERMLQDGSFREDLYYRLKVFPITLPPLRDRREDIMPLVFQFIGKAAQRLGHSIMPNIPEHTQESLRSYSWPGNVRELQNLVEQSLILFAPTKHNPNMEMDKLLPREAEWFFKPEFGQEQRPKNSFLPMPERRRQQHLESLVDERIRHSLELINLNKQASQQTSQTGIWKEIALSSPQNVQEKNPLPTMPLQTLRQATSYCVTQALAAARGKVAGKGGAAEILDINPSTLRSLMHRLDIAPSKS